MGAIFGLIQLVSILLSIAQLVFWIIVLVKMFQEKEILLGILSIFCGLITFIWGWINAEKYNLKKIMLIWTILVIVHFILFGVTMLAVFGAAAKQVAENDSVMVAPGLE